jgi:hypothetical protein
MYQAVEQRPGRKAGLPDTDDPDNEAQCIGTNAPRLKEK